MHLLQSSEEGEKVLCKLNNPFLFFIFILTDFEMQDLYTYKSMAYKDFKVHRTSSR